MESVLPCCSDFFEGRPVEQLELAWAAHWALPGLSWQSPLATSSAAATQWPNLNTGSPAARQQHTYFLGYFVKCVFLCFLNGTMYLLSRNKGPNWREIITALSFLVGLRKLMLYYTCIIAQELWTLWRTLSCTRQRTDSAPRFNGGGELEVLDDGGVLQVRLLKQRCRHKSLFFLPK